MIERDCSAPTARSGLKHGQKTRGTGGRKTVETLTHEEAKRKNIPTAEYQSVMQKEAQRSTPGGL